MSSSPFILHTGSLMQIEKMTMNASQLDSTLNPGGAALTADEQIVFLETSLLTKMIQGKTAANIDDTGYDLSVNLLNYGQNEQDVSYQNIYDASYTYLTPGGDLLINNTVIDTPNLAMITYLDASGFTTIDNSYIIGANKNGDNFYGYISELDPSSIVYITETLDFSFVAAADICNCDVEQKYYVAFNPNDSSSNYWLSKAFNSPLNAHDGAGDGFHPLSVIEPTFNSEYSMGGLSSLTSEAPFNYYYPDTCFNLPNAVPFDNSNNIKTGTTDHIYEITNIRDNGTGPEVLFPNSNFGSWSFTYNDASNAPVVTQDSNLPFFLGVSGNTSYAWDSLPSSLTDASFNAIFPDTDAGAFEFDIYATPHSGGGYHFAAPNQINSGDYFTTILDHEDTHKVELNYGSLRNSQIYMQNNYQNGDHTLNITNGSLTVSGGLYFKSSNTDLFNTGLGGEAEFLTSAQYDTNGSIILQVKPSDERVVVHNNDASLNEISVYYTGESGYSGDSTILDTWRTVPEINIKATLLLSGLHETDTSNGYLYDASSDTVVYNSSSTLYINASVSDVSYSASGFNTDNYTYITINTNTTLLDVSSVNIPLDISASPFGLPLPETGFEPLTQDYNKPWLSMEFEAKDINLVDLSYENFRAVFIPKTLTDLSNNVDGFIRVDPSNGWELITGISQSSGITSTNSFVFGVSDDSGQYLLTKYDNVAIGANMKLDGWTNNYHLSYEYLSNPDISATYSFNVEYISDETSALDKVRFTPIQTDNYFKSPFDKPFTLTAITINKEVIDSSSSQYYSVVQVPLGQYYNLYMKTPTFQSTKDNSGTETFEAVDGSLNTTLSFSTGGLLSLLGAIQGSSDPSSNFSDATLEGNGWETITHNSSDPSASFSSIGVYHDYLSTLDIVDYDGNITINSIFNPAALPNESDYHMVYPMYVFQLDGTLDATFEVKGYSYIKDELLLLDSINTNFNPASFNANLPNNDNLDNTQAMFNLSYNVSNSPGTIGPNTLHIYGTDTYSSNIDATIVFPIAFRSNMHIWYSNYDIYTVDISLNGGGSNEVINTYAFGTVDGSSNNSSVELYNGVYLNNTHNVVVNNSVNFNINGDYIQVRMVNVSDVYQYQNAYFNSVSEINYADGLYVYNTNYTRSLTLPYYRGYTYNSSSYSNDYKQDYTIVRTPTSATFTIAGYDGKPDQTYNFGEIHTETNENMDFVSANIGDVSSIGQIGLVMTFGYSMFDISYNGSINYPVNVTSDEVSIYLYKNGAEYYQSSGLRLDNTNGYLYAFGPGTSNTYNAIFAGKVIANNTGYNEDYNITRASQEIIITHDLSYIGQPNEFSYNAGEQIALVSDLVNGVSLTPSITISMPSITGLNNYNTPETYLVIPPPYLGFTALSTNAVNPDTNGTPFIPFDVSDSNQYDSSQLITWYLPVQTDRANQHINMSFNPFSPDNIDQIMSEYDNNLDGALNNMTFHPFSDASLIDFVYPSSSTYSLNSQGNYLTITETVQGAGHATIPPLFKGFLQDLDTSMVHGANNSYDGEIMNDFATQTYTIVYAQDLTSVGVLSGSDTKITLTIQNAFLHDVEPITIDRSIKTASNLYGVSPTIDASTGKYALALYKYVSRSIDYGILTDISNNPGGNGFTFYADELYTRDPITVIDASFGEVPFNLSTQKSKFSTSDIDPSNNAWTLDQSFNAQHINFEFVPLDNTGVTIIGDLFHTNYDDVVVNANYITLLDVMTVQSGDGSPVFRVLYNGTMISPMLSTSQIIINPIADFNASSENPGQEFVDFNVDTNTGTMADASGIYYRK